LALDEDLELPRDLGPYTLLRRLAVGGMAEVYVAKTNGLGGFEKQVAIKVIHPRYSEDEHFVQMLVEEAKISVLLTHANIAQTFDLGRERGQYYIVMEYIEGADAYRVMRKCAEQKRSIPIDLASFIVAEACSGLDHAHRKRSPDGTPLQIVHRDVSPQNVLLSFSGEVKLVDFGIAKAASRSDHTEAGVIKGKYYYMSPEQAWGDPMDHRSDIFSTGVVLYELLTGRMLYTDENVVVLLDKVRKADIPPPEKRRPSIPKPLSDIVMKALAKSPDDRFQSAQEFAQALSHFLYATSPSFSAARLGDLMGQLFPEQAQRPSGPGSRPPPPREPTPAPPPAASGGAADMAGWDDEDDATRHDVLPFRRLSMAADEAERRPPGAAAPTGRDPGLGTAPLEAPTGPWDDAPTRVREGEDFEDSTFVERASARRAPAPSDAGPVQVVESGRGRVHLSQPAMRAAAAPAPTEAGPRPTSAPRPLARPTLRGAGSPEPGPPPGGATRPPPPRPPAPPTRTPPAPPPTPRNAAPAPLAPAPTLMAPLPEPTEGPLPASQPATAGSPGTPWAAPPAAGWVASAPPAPWAGAPPAAPSAPWAAPPAAPSSPWAAPPAAPTAPAPWAGPVPGPSGPSGPWGGAAPPAPTPQRALATVAMRPSTAEARPSVLGWMGAALVLLVLVVGAAVGVAWLLRAPPTAPSLVVSTTPPGATVLLDGTPLPGTTPLLVGSGLVAGQSYTLEVRLTGHTPHTTTFVASDGSVTQDITLTAEGARLRVETVPAGAAVEIDGVPLGPAPLDVASLRVGQLVTVRASLAGHATAEQAVVVRTDGDRVVLTLVPSP